MTSNRLRVDELEFEVRESDQRKTLEIIIERDGSLAIACPTNVSQDRLHDFIHKKLVWIYTKLGEKEEQESAPTRKEYVNGEGFYYLGKHYRLKIVPNHIQTPPLRLYQGRFQLRRDAVTDAREHFISWYQSHIIPIVQKKIENYKTRVGASPTAIHVRDLGYRWGSTDQRGHIYFHWRVAMLPQQMIAYIIVHEMVHLLESKHSPTFWERIERIIPEYQERKHWLALKGGRYDM